MNLKLFSNLQGDAVSSLVLQPAAPGQLQYFLVAQTVNFTAITSGICEGELPSNEPKSFDIVLSSVLPLIDKNYRFRLTCHNSNILFTEVDKGFTVSPLHVEKISDFAVNAISKFLNSTNSLQHYSDAQEKLDEWDGELRYLETAYRDAKILALSGGVTNNNNNPFEDGTTKSVEAVDAEFKDRIAALKSHIAETKSGIADVEPLDFSKLKAVASIAARNNTVVSMCGNCAIVEISPAYVIQRVDCATLALQGKLLQRLLAESDGEFFLVGDDIVFNVEIGKGRDKTVTRVFLTRYLPSTKIDSTLVTKGAVTEKYSLNLKGILKVLSSVTSKFQTMKFDMGNSKLELENDRGERISYSYDISDAKTIELNKLMRGEKAGNVVMSTVEIPKVVQRILSYMQDEFTLYVKARKIVLQSESLYIVFGR